ncbi:hypothetical protein BG011_001967 [Mortierella polycephala]|uniref:Uncharacterized protein n=1 Tax=Mortierella polycephala TaxID=41804 RepID=A0A9P6Q7R3_9FUNG|nr:hypothetical protein BG011_001967 [Mortierella polycephala]
MTTAMGYSKLPNIGTSLPNFRDAFPSPSFEAPDDYSRVPSPSSANVYIAPLSASSLKAYNNMNGKRKALIEAGHESKRMMFSRQRQESGSSISSTSTWASSGTFSTVSSVSYSSPSPILSASPRTISKSSSPSPSLSPSLSESTSSTSGFNPLFHLCDAIALSEKDSTENAGPCASSTAQRSTLKIVFLKRNWLAEHIAKSKEVAALKRRRA